MLVAFFVMNVILNTIFSPIAPLGAMEEMMVAIMLTHPELNTFPIILPIPIILITEIPI